MILCRMLTALLAVMVVTAQAEVVKPAIRESTDPSKVAAVERAVADLKVRQALDLRSGRNTTSASVVTGRTEAGIDFLSGGIADRDRLDMYAQRARYSLWVATLAKPSGAYLSDAHLRIIDLTSGQALIDRTMDGPWFFAALPVGRYEVSATVQADDASKPQTLHAQVNVSFKGQRQAVLRFDSDAQVGPELGNVPRSNPFGTPPG